MGQELSIGIIGDFDPNKMSHKPTNDALKHVADNLSVNASIIWLPTASLATAEGLQKLEIFDGLMAAPGSPYESFDGAINAIQQARLRDTPLLGT